MDHKDLCEHTKIRLIAATIGHQQCTRTAANLIPLPGTDRVIAIGTRGEVARLLAGSAAEQPTGDLPPLPLDLDNTNPRISMHVKAGELAEQLHRWGREVYAAGQSQATSTVSAPEEVREQWPAEPTSEMQQAGASAIRFDTTVLNKIWTANAVYRAIREVALRTTSGKGEAA